MKKNKNKYQILPLAVLLLILTISFSALSATGAGKGSFSQTTSNGKSLPSPVAVSAEDEHICGLKEVVCDKEGNGNSVATMRVTSVPSFFQADDSVIAGEKVPLSAGSSTLGIISFYSAIDSCHTGVSCLMANGKKAQIGYVACPRRYKLGTKVRIDGKVYECGDRTAKWVDGRFDVFTGYGIEAYNQALSNGIKKLTVEIL